MGKLTNEEISITVSKLLDSRKQLESEQAGKDAAEENLYNLYSLLNKDLCVDTADTPFHHYVFMEGKLYLWWFGHLQEVPYTNLDAKS